MWAMGEIALTGLEVMGTDGEVTLADGEVI